MLYLLKCKVCGEVPYVRKEKKKLFATGATIKKVTIKHSEKVTKKFHAHYCLDGHSGIDDWSFMVFEQCETHEQLKEIETFWQHRLKTFYSIGLNEKEEYLYQHKKTFLVLVLDFSSNEVILFYLFLYHYHHCVLFIYSFIHLLIYLYFYSMYLFFDLFIIFPLYLHKLLPIFILFLTVLTLTSPFKPTILLVCMSLCVCLCLSLQYCNTTGGGVYVFVVELGGWWRVYLHGGGLVLN